MMYQRGDVVTCVLSGDYGKPRPAVIVQSDVFNPTHASITVCPITSYLLDAPLFRLTVTPSAENGLYAVSQIMMDKISSIKVEKIHQKIGVFAPSDVLVLQDALKLWLSL